MLGEKARSQPLLARCAAATHASVMHMILTFLHFCLEHFILSYNKDMKEASCLSLQPCKMSEFLFLLLVTTAEMLP